MAIKGKRKTRHRSSRTVAGAPRPYLVRPKTPLFQRTGTKVVLVILGWSLVFLVLVLAGAQTKADDRRDQISEFTTLVQAQLYQSGAAQQSFTGPLILPELGQAVSELQSGELRNPDEVATNAEGWADVATQAGNNIGQIEAEGLGLTESRNLMEQGLLLYAGLADEIRVAVQLEGVQQRELSGTIAEQMGVAATVFDTGWGKLQEERRKAGLQTESVLPGDLGGLPGGVPGLTGPGDVPAP
jgi:type II secretory pathway pseudopilin PulG